MYAQLGSVSDANARLPKMSVIENKIPNTIPVSTVFIVKTPRNVRHISLGRACQKFLRESMSKMRRWCCVIGHRGDLPRYTQGALFFAKVKIARSNVSRAAVSRLRLCDGHHQKYEFDAAVALSTDSYWHLT